MILSGQEIEELCKGARPLIKPFHQRTKEFGLTFGLGPAGYDVRIAQDIVFSESFGKNFKLASTMECFDIPNWLIGIVHDKSTWARLGLAVQNTVMEPGWVGYLTLEISNHSGQIVHCKRGMAIAQILFHVLSKPTNQTYEGKYQNQPDKPVGAILE